jgi:hypothetical protein
LLVLSSTIWALKRVLVKPSHHWQCLISRIGPCTFPLNINSSAKIIAAGSALYVQCSHHNSILRAHNGRKIQRSSDDGTGTPQLPSSRRVSNIRHVTKVSNLLLRFDRAVYLDISFASKRRPMLYNHTIDLLVKTIEWHRRSVILNCLFGIY